MPLTASSMAWLLPVTLKALPDTAPDPELPPVSYETAIRALCVTVLVWTERIVWSEARSQPTWKIHCHFPTLVMSTANSLPQQKFLCSSRDNLNDSPIYQRVVSIELTLGRFSTLLYFLSSSFGKRFTCD